MSYLKHKNQLILLEYFDFLSSSGYYMRWAFHWRMRSIFMITLHFASIHIRWREIHKVTCMLHRTLCVLPAGLSPAQQPGQDIHLCLKFCYRDFRGVGTSSTFRFSRLVFRLRSKDCICLPWITQDTYWKSFVDMDCSVHFRAALNLGTTSMILYI